MDRVRQGPLVLEVKDESLLSFLLFLDVLFLGILIAIIDQFIKLVVINGLFRMIGLEKEIDSLWDFTVLCREETGFIGILLTLLSKSGVDSVKLCDHIWIYRNSVKVDLR